MSHLSEINANRVWDVLVEIAGARVGERDAFVRYLTEEVSHGHEYRFMGHLGFGGKLHYSRTRGAWVGYYPEDRTEERDVLMGRVNAKLAEMGLTS